MTSHGQETESGTQPLPRSQEGSLLPQFGSDTESRASSSNFQYESVGDVGEGWTRRIATLAFGLSGGILGQLTTETEDRLAEMRECVNWYEDQVVKYEKKLADLRQLGDFLERAKQIRSLDESNQDEFTEDSIESD